jgi:protein-S-isoprenylcysteine O-methyltransferase Ste14
MDATPPPDSLARRAFSGLIRFQIFLALLLLVPAGTVRYWQAWVYWLLMAACLTSITFYFLRFDPALVESRLKAGPTAERRKEQKPILALASVALCGTFLVPAIERRLHPPVVSPLVSLAADALVVASFAFIFLVFRENSHASSIIEVKEDQRVISTGPYRLVRHPMYSASILLFLATPPALGSLWGLIPAVGLSATIIARLLDEERYLAQQLPGYEEYRRQVPHRLLPHVW